MSFSGGRQVQPGHLRTMADAHRETTTTSRLTCGGKSPAGQRRMKPAVGRVVNTLRSALEELQKEGGSPHVGPGSHHISASGDHSQPVAGLAVQVKALQKGFGMLADAVLGELETMREDAAKVREERTTWVNNIKEQHFKLQSAVDLKLEELDNFRIDMEQWKQGVTDVLARARHEVLAASFQPLDDKLEEMNVVLSGLVKSSASAQLAVIQLENRLESHVDEYTASQSSHDAIFASVRSLVESSEAAAARASEALAADMSDMHEELQRISDTQEAFTQQTVPRLEALQQKVTAVAQHQARHANGLEDIIRGLLSDMQSVSKRERVLEHRVNMADASSSDTYEALARSCRVFAAALKIPSPIPAVPSTNTGSHR